MRKLRSKSGQSMVEYIIIIVIIAIAAIAIFGVFGDTIRQKLSGAVASVDDGDLQLFFILVSPEESAAH